MRRSVLIAVLGALLVSTAACGSRRDLDALQYGQGGVPAGGAAAAGVSGVANGDVPADPGATAAQSAVPVPGGAISAPLSGRTSQSPGGARSGGSGTAAAPLRTAGSAEGNVAPSGARVPSPAGATASAAGASGTPAVAGCAPRCEPIVVGHVGTYSGVFSSFANAPQGLLAWAQAVNARGGIDGHPVKAIVAEDNGDPAKHRALVQQMVERDGVISFIHGFNPSTGNAAVDYLTKKGVPVVGGDPSSNWYYDSPMYFPHASLGKKGVTKSLLGATAEAAVPQGKTKLALLACNEAQICRDLTADMPTFAGQFGLKVVSQAQASLAQPDYTAECLAARNAGAEILFMAFDSQSYGRVARSCASINYKPMFSLVPNVTNNIVDIKEMEGAVITAIVYPWFDASHPAIAQMHQAMKQYTPRAQADNEAGLAWSSAVLFERAATGRLSAKPTSAEILDGLWSLKGETLGGLTYPLTFVKGQNAEVKSCWWLARIANGAFQSPRKDVKCV